MDLAWKQVWFWGAVGGALPTVSKIAATFGANFDAPMPNMLGVAIALVLYAVIGSVMARAIGKKEMREALFAGIAAPAIIVSIIAGVSDSQSLHPGNGNGNKQINYLFTSSAYAQTSPQTSAENSKTLNVEFTSRSNYPIDGVIAVYASVDGEKKRIVTLPVNTASKNQVTIEIPNQTKSLSFVASTGAQASVPVTGNSNVKLILTPKTTTISDFVWALGGQRTVGIGAIQATLQDQSQNQNQK